MDESHKQYFQNALKQNKAIQIIPKSKSDEKKKKESTKEEKSSSEEHIVNHITVSNTEQLTNNDALNMIEWLNVIISSPDNQLKSINIDLSNDPNKNIDSSTNLEIIDSKCINKLCDAICSNPNKSLDLEALEFKSVSMNLENVQYIFDSIRFKCRYCEYLSLENCLNSIKNGSNDITEIIYNYYYDNDYYGLRNTYLSEIDLYGNKFEFSWIFHNHSLVALNRKMKRFLRFAIKSYGDFLLNESVIIHTNDPYFKFCLFPQLRMTLGVISREYPSYTREVVRFNRRNWNEESIKYWRKIAIISWFLFTTGFALRDIFKRGKKSWWFKVAEIVGLDNVKKRKRDPNKPKKKKQDPWWKRLWGV